MGWFWTADPAPGAALTHDDLEGAGVGQRFETQKLAEQWLTAFYPELLDLGVTGVSLFEEDRLVYGPMALDEA
ncbi:MAG TPA: hypothetical protein PKN27_01715 [Propionibacteriaceae bacterium]|nr:hypothetical protein [Propionibacteriaceae bacterium]